MKGISGFILLSCILLNGCSTKNSLPVSYLAAMNNTFVPVNESDKLTGKIVESIIANDYNSFTTGKTYFIDWRQIPKNGNYLPYASECTKKECNKDGYNNSARLYAIYYMASSAKLKEPIRGGGYWGDSPYFTNSKIIDLLFQDEVYLNQYHSDLKNYNLVTISDSEILHALSTLRTALIKSRDKALAKRLEDERISLEITNSPRVSCKVPDITPLAGGYGEYLTTWKITNDFISHLNSNKLTCKTKGNESLEINGRPVLTSRDRIAQTLYVAISRCQGEFPYHNKPGYAEYNSCVKSVAYGYSLWFKAINNKKISNEDFRSYIMNNRLGPSSMWNW